MTSQATPKNMVDVEPAKLEIVASSKEDDSNVTFCLHREDHTLGNSVRYAIIRNPDVQYCGYSLPHPTEDKIHLRIQTNGKSAAQALDQGLDKLIEIFTHIRSEVARLIPGADAEPVPSFSIEDEEEAEAEAEAAAEEQMDVDAPAEQAAEAEEAEEEEEQEEADAEEEELVYGQNEGDDEDDS